MQDPKGTSVSLLNGTHFANAVNGNVFIGNQLPAGVAPALWSATTQQCGLINPATSNKFIVPIRITGTYVSGTGIVDGLCLGYFSGVQSGVTAGAVTAATTIAPINAKLGSPAGVGIFMSAGITCVAPTRLLSLGQNTEVGATLAAVSNTPLIYDFDGLLVIPPGYGIVLAADITGITAVYSFSIVWAEVQADVANKNW